MSLRRSVFVAAFGTVPVASVLGNAFPVSYFDGLGSFGPLFQGSLEQAGLHPTQEAIGETPGVGEVNVALYYADYVVQEPPMFVEPMSMVVHKSQVSLVPKLEAVFRKLVESGRWKRDSDAVLASLGER